MQYSPIEVVTFKETEAIGELVRKSYDALEPGFQVDQVSSVDELEMVFEAILAATPIHATRVGSFNFADRIKEKTSFVTPPHTDRGAHDLAGHLEIEHEYPVILGTSQVGQLNDYPIKVFPDDKATNIRGGTTRPGRLTFFSQGGYDWLPLTIHFFDRQHGQNAHWIRFSNVRLSTGFAARRKAVRAFRDIGSKSIR